MNETLETIRSILSDSQKRFADNRIHLCRLEAADVTADTAILQGEVLDRETLAAVATNLSMHLPDINLNTTAINVLRATSPRYLIVSSNVTELYEEPSFLATRSSTLLNGTVGELLKEDGRWAFVRLVDGYLGWLYQPYLAEFQPQKASLYTHLVRVPFSILREKPNESSSPATRVLAGTYATLETAENGWAEISLASGLSGYLPLADLCALETLPVGEERRTQIAYDAFQYIGVPYLWGGSSVLGIDCSGFAQLLHRLIGVAIPRDADMQYAAGRPVEPPFKSGDLLFFGGTGGHRGVSHVGVSLGSDWGMIHASRSRNGVYVDDVAAVASLRDSYAGTRSFL